MQRREFMKSACIACLAPGLGSLTALFSSCASAPVYRAEPEGDTLRVPASALGADPVTIVRAAGADYDIALVKTGPGTFGALLLRCTHADNTLAYRGSEFTCSLHGSRFDTEGHVIHGPASLPLKRLPVSLDGGVITIRTDPSVYQVPP